MQTALDRLTTYVAIGLIVFGALGAAGAFNARHPHYFRNLASNEIQRYNHSVVRVLNLARTGGGTGFAVTAASGAQYILTNNHVCNVEEGNSLAVRLNSGPEATRFQVVQKVAISAFTDLCLLSTVDDLESLPIATTEAVVGQTLIAYGHPILEPLSPSTGVMIGQDDVTLQWNASPEKCQGLGYELKESPFFFFGQPFGSAQICFRTVFGQFTTLPIYPGNSGSPVVDKNGDVVGVVFAGNGYTRYGIMIPLPAIREFLRGN